MAARGRRSATALLALTAVATGAGPAPAQPQGRPDAVTGPSAQDRSGRAATAWSEGWSVPVQRPSTGFHENWAETGFDRQTVRQVVRVTDSGTAARIRLSNRYGDAPLKLAGATIARRGEGAAVRSGSLRHLAFGRGRSAVIPAGGELVSDAATLRVTALESLTVTLYFAGPTGPATFHAQGFATTYRAARDHRAGEGSEAVGDETESWYYLSGVEVSGGTGRPGRPRRGAVVAFGDSITDGFGSSKDADKRYPDALADRLAARGAPRPVLNAGIGGNLMLNDSRWFGEHASARFQRDVLDRPGVGSVIVLAGLNDIGFSEVDLPAYQPNPQVSVAELIAGYRELIERAHAEGIKATGATLLPFKGSEYHTPRSEAKRTALNEWIRTSGAYDSVVDFAQVLAAPSDADLLAPRYDSGDHKHPNDAGYRAMAEAVDLSSL
ncbi:SGNH/GDSL hydrolase family protein [Streptomyces sp. H27-D2]|uniref:SGNH/GDSL hydrolase family protein n=1 Tax=Streptomyces sp. H27-D2 TaxID=3046304 RepID=UPI002DBD8FF1|nr:SGNH/GDSL hydrolase family protein [Streptomyces sp. H27-D2]MEC4020299.1 SGNH/GDSL hydrolase family protein [Streptomyces sp. H27-D2]